MSEIKVILFDLGGVLLELDGPPIKNHWIEEELTHEQSWQRWMSSRYVKRFETGSISVDEFVSGVVQELGINLSEGEFRKAFIDWPKELFDGAAEMLTALKKRYHIAFFSNTSELHLPRLLDKLKLADYFHNTYASYEIGFFKPDIAGFHYVADDLDISVENILFIDDNQVNVDGAVRAGMRAKKAVGLNQVEQVLREFGCLV